MRTFCVSQTRSAMSVAVTEPKSVPVSPAGTSKRSSCDSSRCVISWACSKLCASCRARLSSSLRSSGTLAGVAGPARLRGGREVLGEPAAAGTRDPRRDVEDLAADPDLLDVLPEDDFHQPVEYGRSAISRARLTACATCRW